MLDILRISYSTYYDSLKPKISSRKRGQAPPGYSYSLAGEKVSDDQLVLYLKDYRKDPFLKVEGGAKVLSKYIRRDHAVVVNHKKVARLCKIHNLSIARAKKKKSKFRKVAMNHEVTRENQVWEFDIKYSYLHGEKRFFFLLAFIDVFTREVKGWYIGYHCQATDVYSTLRIALENHSILNENELIIRSDNGPQMRANLLKEKLKNLPADHEFIPVRTPNKNPHIESFFSIVDRHLQEQYFWNFKDAYRWMIEFMDFYNESRIHGSLGMSPREFSARKEIHGQEKFMQPI